MFAAIYVWLEKHGTWKRAGLLAMGCIACSVLFTIRDRYIESHSASYPGKAPDARSWYKPEAANDYFRLIGPDGRNLFALTELTLDVVFPVIYASFLAVLVVRLCRPLFARVWMWVPWAMACADWGENTLLVYLATHFTDKPSSLATPAASLTATKWGLLVVYWIGLIGAMVTQWLKGRKKSQRTESLS